MAGQQYNKEELMAEAYEIGKVSKAKGKPKAVMLNEEYRAFSTTKKVSLHLSHDIELDTAVMNAFHRGYEGKPLHEDENNTQGAIL